jgi:hypothetical protein
MVQRAMADMHDIKPMGPQYVSSRLRMGLSDIRTA